METLVIMALGGLAPLIIFKFSKSLISLTSVTSNLGPVQPTIKIPYIPIPLYLEERITGIALDDYDRDISIDVMRDGVSAFERISGDVVNLKFRMQKSNIVLTALTANIDRILKSFNDDVLSKSDDRNYSMTIFYDNIFVLDASLERFHSTLLDGTDLREITLTFSKRSEKTIEVLQNPIERTLGTSAGI